MTMHLNLTKEIYTAVIPENVPTDFSIVTVKATDVDSGTNGEVQYILQEGADNTPVNFFAVDSQTGVVSVVRALFSSICHLLVVIGDISTNDGVPQFIRPTAGEVAYIHENVTVGTEVFQVVAFDPDNSNTANGKVAYKLLDDQSSEDSGYEFVDSNATGVISDSRLIGQRTEPQFQRPLKSQLHRNCSERRGTNRTIAGVVKAVDNDTGVNSIIDYYILSGNEDDVFSIRRSSNNEGELMVQKRIDRERVDKFTLTIKVSKPSEPVTEFGETYNYQDLSQTQVTILVEDIDDNPPKFENSNYVLGARGNTDVDTELVTLHAFDPDVSSSPMMYSIKSMAFIRVSIL
ncbi:cadherin-23 [Caerostris extrusa]|uniref:Cadherin-23 n=1 Tax=Caerostris extrusa TaxID=172846 RepID=A0AAV4Q2C8_CAEEX|nr:cadherin-23 [Caerostris extrusa]